MPDARTELYAQHLAALIRQETVSSENQTDKQKFYAFQKLLWKQFPKIFACCEHEDFDGSFLLRWKGSSSAAPVMLMNHHDVVEAPGNWTYPPFSGTISGEKLWGRGTLDTKCGLWAMLQAAEELLQEGFIPRKDIYFVSACTEETDGSGAKAISEELKDRGIRFDLVLDEGGMILEEPIGGAKGTFAMIGLGEKGCADLKFIARSSGGHSSTPGKNTPLVRLGKFMAAAEKAALFRADMHPVVQEMLRRIAATMAQPLKFILGHPGWFKPLLLKVMPAVSNTAGAMLKTTLAFTMAKGSEGSNVLPQEAWVMGNMRFSHHQGGENSIAAVRVLAEKYDIETVVVDPGFSSPMSDYRSEGFQLVERAVAAAFPGVIPSPYLMTGASDSRFMGQICDTCIRFAPIAVSETQMAGIHGIDENVDLSALAPAVDFYKYILMEV